MFDWLSGNAVSCTSSSGLGPPAAAPRSYTTPRELGPARVDLTHALRVAADLEDDALARRLEEGR